MCNTEAMNFEQSQNADPRSELIARLHGAKAEIVATGRFDSELSFIDGLITQLNADPTFAREAEKKLALLRAGRQEDAEQGIDT